jgi:triosephosphate isomerase
MKKVIALNLKMNLGYEEVEDYINAIINKISDKNDVIFFPSSLYLELFKKSGYQIGAQNVYYLDKGAFTGEISPLQLKTLGVSYVLIGHSERRLHFGEDDKLINSKIKGCLKNNLKVILCIGETIEEKQLRKTALVLEKQIINGLKGIDKEDLTDVIIAYEPVWAIGSGKTPRDEEIEDAINFITKIINREFDIEPIVLYGGSINKDNIQKIMHIKNVDGTLIGSSSLDSKYLLSMLDLVD